MKRTKTGCGGRGRRPRRSVEVSRRRASRAGAATTKVFCLVARGPRAVAPDCLLVIGLRRTRGRGLPARHDCQGAVEPVLGFLISVVKLRPPPPSRSRSRLASPPKPSIEARRRCMDTRLCIYSGSHRRPLAFAGNGCISLRRAFSVPTAGAVSIAVIFPSSSVP